MNGLDAVIFTGGIGENAPEVRSGACCDMDYLGINLNEKANKETRGELKRISSDESKVQVWVVPTNEELLIARDTRDLVLKIGNSHLTSQYDNNYIILGLVIAIVILSTKF